MDWSLRRNTGLPLVQQRNAQLNFTVPPSILLRVATNVGYVGLWHCTSSAGVQQNPTLMRSLRTCRRPGGGSAGARYAGL